MAMGSVKAAAALALALGACLAGCGWDPGRSARPSEAPRPAGSSLAHGDLVPVMVEVQGIRTASRAASAALEPLRVSRVAGDSGGLEGVVVRVGPGPGRSGAPSFSVEAAQGQGPLGVALLTLPYAPVAGGPAWVARVHGDGRLGWLDEVESDPQAGTATFVAQVPGVYVAWGRAASSAGSAASAGGSVSRIGD